MRLPLATLRGRPGGAGLPLAGAANADRIGEACRDHDETSPEPCGGGRCLADGRHRARAAVHDFRDGGRGHPCHPGANGSLHEQGIERFARYGRTAGRVDPGFPTSGGNPHRMQRHGGWLALGRQGERGEFTDRRRRQTTAAHLGPGESTTIHEQHAPPEPREPERRSRAGRPGSDDEHVPLDQGGGVDIHGGSDHAGAPVTAVVHSIMTRSGQAR